MPTSRAPSKASERSHEHHQDEHRHAHYPRRRSPRRHGSPLQGSHRQARVRTIVRGHGARDPAPDRSDGRGRAEDVPAESLFLNTVKYENDKLEAYMRKLTKK